MSARSARLMRAAPKNPGDDTCMVWVLAVPLTLYHHAVAACVAKPLTKIVEKHNVISHPLVSTTTL